MAKKSWRMRMGKLVRVKNTQKHGNEADSFLITKLQGPGGREFYVAFTDHEMKRPTRRAKRNAEDMLETTGLRDLID